MFAAWQVLALVAMCLVVLILALVAVRVAFIVYLANDADIQQMRRNGWWGPDRISRKTYARRKVELEESEVSDER